MKIVIFGCQQIAVDSITFLYSEKGLDIPLVITYELPMDRTYGYKSVLEEAGSLGLKVINPDRVSDDLVREIKRLAPDLILSIYYRKIFPKELLDIPRLGCVNVHPSLLPEYRGPVPTAWAIMKGEKKAGVTLHLMDGGIDTGDILVQKEFDIIEDETGFELYTRTMKVGFELLKGNIDKILSKEIKPRKQSGTGSFYGKLRGKNMINWQRSCLDIKNLVRVCSRPYSPAESVLFNKYVLINKVSVLDNAKYVLQGTGFITDVLRDDKLVVSCADGFLVLEDYEIVPKMTELEKKVYLKKGNRLDTPLAAW